MGLEGRLHLEWISSAEAQKFVQVVTDFTEKIKALGPSPLALFNADIKALSPGPSKTSAADLFMQGADGISQSEHHVSGL